MTRVMVALGGNALQRAGGSGTWAEAVAQMHATASTLATLVRGGCELLLTHGNGPQVGDLLRAEELAAREVSARPMYVLGAETAGQIGYLIAQELTKALRRARAPRAVVPVICRIIVSRNDPAFEHPEKPIGRYYSETEARVLRKREGWEMVYDGARGGWRRVVPSPKPIGWAERDILPRLLSPGWGRRLIPVLAGGGGVPVIERERGIYEGVDAVIDKDLTAAMIAHYADADILAIVTDVPAVAIGFRRPWEKWLRRATDEEMQRYLAGGEFGKGSMAPKIEAALGFLAGGGKSAVITDPPSLARAIRGEAGTRIVRS
jgi:carbamate kinase